MKTKLMLAMPFAAALCFGQSGFTVYQTVSGVTLGTKGEKFTTPPTKQVISVSAAGVVAIGSQAGDFISTHPEELTSRMIRYPNYAVRHDITPLKTVESRMDEPSLTEPVATAEKHCSALPKLVQFSGYETIQGLKLAHLKYAPPGGMVHEFWRSEEYGCLDFQDYLSEDSGSFRKVTIDRIEPGVQADLFDVSGMEEGSLAVARRKDAERVGVTLDSPDISSCFKSYLQDEAVYNATYRFQRDKARAAIAAFEASHKQY